MKTQDPYKKYYFTKTQRLRNFDMRYSNWSIKSELLYKILFTDKNEIPHIYIYTISDLSASLKIPVLDGYSDWGYF